MKKWINTLLVIITFFLAYDHSSAQKLSGGGYHSYMLCHDGLVRAAGRNDYGQLGDGTTSNTPTPVQVQSLSAVVDIDASTFGGFAVRNNGTLWTWGCTWLNVTQTIPVQVGGISDAINVDGGQNHTLVLRSDSTVWSAGWNFFGQLGNGSTGGANTIFTKINNLNGIVAVSTGSGHSLALKKDGTVWAWGDNKNGQLGDSSNVNKYSPVKINKLSGIIAIDAGSQYSLALKNDGTVWTWGGNSYGGLGNGTLNSSWVPVQISALTNVKAIAANPAGFHSLCLKGDSTVWSWGANGNGQLGDSSAVDKVLPVKINGLKGVVGVGCGTNHSLAFKSDGTIWTFGWNVYGQLAVTGYIITSPVKSQFSCNSTTSIEEKAVGSSLKIFPNPVNEVLSIQLFSGANEQITIEITDVLGRTVSSQPPIVSDGANKNINVGALTKGIYFLKWSIGAEQVVQKFIKE